MSKKEKQSKKKKTKQDKDVVPKEVDHVDNKDQQQQARDEEPTVTRELPPNTKEDTTSLVNDEPGDDDDDDAAADDEQGGAATAKKRRKRKRKRKKEEDETAVDDEGESKPVATTATDEKKCAEVDRTCYVEGIPFTATPDQVKQFFVDGHCDDITDLRLPVWQDSGRLRGYGHVVFESATSQARAIAELSGKYLNGRYLTIQPAVKPKDVTQQPQSLPTDGTTASSEPSKTILLHNLSYQAVEDDIEAVLSKFGAIAAGGVRVVRHSGSSQSKGFGYVTFAELASAVAVMTTTTPIQILGRHCRVDYDHGRVRGSFRTADRKLWQKEYGGSGGNAR